MSANVSPTSNNKIHTFAYGKPLFKTDLDACP